MLSWTIYLSFLGVLVLLLLPAGDARSARAVALMSAIGGLMCALAGVMTSPAGLFTITKVPWVKSLGIEFHLAADGISLVLVLLTGLAAVSGILFSWNIEHRAKEFFAFFLALIGSVYGVFLSFDLFTLFVFYELAIIPKYFLIAVWGSTRKEYGAMKLALYSFVGSAMVLVGLIAAFVVSGGKTFDLIELAKFPFPEQFQVWVFPLVFVGFAILAGLWPFHTWAPTGHVAAPTAASMLLAGVVMKLGAYGALRVAITLFPLGLVAWQTELALLAVIGIVGGAMVALTQKDLKFVIGYSSVSHMGFVLLGLATLNTIGLSGAVLQMFSHGIIAGLLFGVVGRMVYDRTHTRELTVLEGMGLLKALPFAAVTFAIAAVASMGLPGFSGFIAELQVLVGAWQTLPGFAVAAGVGIVIGVAYTLRALQKAFFTDETAADTERRTPVRHEPDGTGPAHADQEIGAPLEPITIPERLGAALLLGTTILIGLHPRLLLDIIVPSFDSPLFDALRKGGLQ